MGGTSFFSIDDGFTRKDREELLHNLDVDRMNRAVDYFFDLEDKMNADDFLVERKMQGRKMGTNRFHFFAAYLPVNDRIRAHLNGSTESVPLSAIYLYRYNDEGQTPLQVAEALGRTENARVLREMMELYPLEKISPCS